MKRNISPYSVRMQENTDQNNFEYGHLSRSVHLCFWNIFGRVLHQDFLCYGSTEQQIFDSHFEKKNSKREHYYSI